MRCEHGPWRRVPGVFPGGSVSWLVGGSSGATAPAGCAVGITYSVVQGSQVRRCHFFGPRLEGSPASLARAENREWERREKCEISNTG